MASESTAHPVVPLSELRVGAWYNAAVQFKAITTAKNVPNALPKHRVYLYSVSEYRGQVKVFYMTSFGGKTPRSFHGATSLSTRKYLPVGNQGVLAEYPQHYLTVSTTPNVLHGWLNFSEPISIAYGGVRDREKLRPAPEAQYTRRPSPLALPDSPTGLEPEPLPELGRPESVMGQIISPTWVRDYIGEISSAWEKTVRMPSPDDGWLNLAKEIKKRVQKRKRLEEKKTKRQELQWGDEWMGIKDLSDNDTDEVLPSSLPGHNGKNSGGRGEELPSKIKATSMSFDGTNDSCDKSESPTPTPGRSQHNVPITPSPSYQRHRHGSQFATTPTPTTMPLTPLSEAPKHLPEISRAILNPTQPPYPFLTTGDVESRWGDFDPYMAIIELYEIDSEKPGEGVDEAFEWDEISYYRVLIGTPSLDIL